MKSAPGKFSSAASVSLLILNGLTATPECRAQAWVPPQGDGAVSVSYQWINNTGHILTNGTYVNAGRSADMSIYLEGEYAVTDRFAAGAGIPFVAAKYTDASGPPPPIPYLPVDQCHCWHTGLQDFYLDARYNLIGRKWFALTPSLAGVIPSQKYNYRGEAALGRDLREFRFGIDAGERADRISRNLSFQERYSYAIVQRILAIPDNRSNMGVDANYLIRKRLALRGSSTWQRTHGGLRLGSPPPSDLIFPGEVDTPELLAQHDRLLRDDNWRAGGGVAYSFDRMDIFASYLAFISGTDTHAGGALTIGFSVPIHLGGSRR